jgi:hypothetical protein
MKSRRSRRSRAGGNGQMPYMGPIANWQAKYAWYAAMWGLIPVVGLLLGITALILGLLGRRRCHRRPEDHGLNYALGGIVMGSVEIVVNISGLACILVGLRELGLLH